MACSFTGTKAERKINLRVYGIDFAEVVDGFDFASAIIVVSYAGRYRATGVLGDRLVTVVIAPLGTEAISIISLRPASRKDTGSKAPMCAPRDPGDCGCTGA